MVHRSYDLSSTLTSISKDLSNQLSDPIWALRWASHTLEGFQACIRSLEFHIISITPLLTPWWHLLLHDYRCITFLQYLRLDDASIRKCLLRYHNFLPNPSVASVLIQRIHRSIHSLGTTIRHEHQILSEHQICCCRSVFTILFDLNNKYTNHNSK
jgi:hypothetical protein